ncbi:MAG: UDP-N-acetylglucosamine 2-epimerase (non-hydrolyzing) [Actinomycetota bacterium]|nr:UDP-N-acetylglucosamine 2-epimerase (non-hydrolyzing) [Actinomycetota bacterium]
MAIRALVGFGTRPEAIKMAPMVKALQGDPLFDIDVVTTGQHTSILRQVLDVFSIEPTLELELVRSTNSLGELTSKLMELATSAIEKISPDVVIVQGDTTTTFVLALAAFYAKTKVVHLEAGLRTSNPYSPFPEEINRRITSQLADLHLAPTSIAARNLLNEAIPKERIVTTGNTVIDALLEVIGGGYNLETTEVPDILASNRRYILVTMHRRESWGEPMVQVSTALGKIAKKYPEFDLVLPLHPNELVQSAMRSGLDGASNVKIISPAPYVDFCRLMNGATLILTDSGGIQEEAPSLGKPVLVARDTTERPEAIAAGVAKLVGTDPVDVVREITRLLDDGDYYNSIARRSNPFGDGKAAIRSAEAVKWLFGQSDRPSDFIYSQD